MVDSINNPFRQMKGYCQIDGGETFYGGGSVAENSKLSDVEKLKNKSVWTLDDRKQAERCLNDIDFSTRASDNDTEEAKAAFELWGRMKTETTKLTGSKALDAVNEALASEEPVPEVKLTESEEVSAAEDEEPEDEVDDEEGSVIYDVAEYSDKNARPFAPVQYVTEEVPVSVDDSKQQPVKKPGTPAPKPPVTSVSKKPVTSVSKKTVTSAPKKPVTSAPKKPSGQSSSSGKGSTAHNPVDKSDYVLFDLELRRIQDSAKNKDFFAKPTPKSKASGKGSATEKQSVSYEEFCRKNNIDISKFKAELNANKSYIRHNPAKQSFIKNNPDDSLINFVQTRFFK